MMEGRIIQNKQWRRIITLYSQNIKKTMETIKKKIKEEEKKYLLLRGLM